MLHVDRRRFLQSTSMLVAGGVARGLWAADADTAPTFAKEPTYDPFGLFLTWQRDPTTTMTVQWVGAAGEAGGRPVWYAKHSGGLWRFEKTAARPFPLTERKMFRAELTGLEPDTDYVFHVGLDSAPLRFRTMPTKATNAIHFVSGGDAGIGPQVSATNKVAAAQAPLFAVIGGDIAYENGRAALPFLEFLRAYSRDMRDPEGRLIPLLACLGNHEVDGGYHKGRDKAPFFYACFDGLFPEKGFASLDFGDYLSIILLDTEHTTPIAGEQTDWLAKTLKEREEMPTVFVFNHVPAYPCVRPFYDTESESGTGWGNRKHWCPLFERYNVDAVFEHHDHAYKRSHPMMGGHISTNGIVYLGDGSWGKIRRPDGPEKRPYLAKTDEAYHLSVHRIEGETRHHVALSDKGRVVDVCTTSKRAHRRG